MSDVAVSERLRQARRARGEDIPSLATRIGVRQEHLRAIEDGRFPDLPPGIYGRAAVKSFATACGFDPAEVLAACESSLPVIEEPIAALARLRGVRPTRPDPPPAVAVSTIEPAVPAAVACPGWRVLAAALVDAVVIVVLLLVVVVCALTALTVPPAALRHSAPAFGLMGILLAIGYFTWFGGIAGVTAGERLLGVTRHPHEHSRLTLRAIAARCMRAATEDARFIQQLGAWIGRVS